MKAPSLAHTSMLVLAVVCIGFVAPAAASGLKQARTGGIAGCSLGEACYVGHWEFVAGRSDGRYQGRSARSFTRGDSLAIPFYGSRLAIYGLTGPTGGKAELIVDSEPPVTLDFYGPQRRTHVLVFQASHLDRGPHALMLVVSGLRNARSSGSYVNVDQVQVDATARDAWRRLVEDPR
jgi:hypothetical protein